MEWMDGVVNSQTSLKQTHSALLQGMDRREDNWYSIPELDVKRDFIGDVLFQLLWEECIGLFHGLDEKRTWAVRAFIPP